MKFWKTFLIVTIPYALLMCIFKMITGDFGSDDLPGVVIASVLFGVMFTFAMQFFVRFQMKRIKVELEPDEKLIKEGGANRILNLEGVGGKLAITDKRLVFRSHKLNVQVHQLSIFLSGIQSVEAAKTGGILTNVLMVYMKNEEKYKFIVFEPGDWVKEIQSRLPKQ